MNTNRNLFLNYQKSFIFDYTETTPFIFEKNDWESELKNILKNKEEFINLKDLIINNPHYPLFVYAAKLYSNDFLEIFKSDDNTYSLQNAIACTLANDMIYLNTTDVNIIPDMKNDFLLVDNNNRTYINPSMKWKNRYLAMKYYDEITAYKIFNSSVAYFNLYKQELGTLKDIALDDVFKAFKNLQSYHARKYILNTYLFDLTLSVKDNAQTFFSILDEIESFSIENNFLEFKDDIEHIRIAYNFRNK